MLKKEFLEVRKRKPNIAPKYRTIEENMTAAESVIEIYEVGRSKGEIEKEVSELETHDNFKFVRALSSLMERWSEFEVAVEVDPSELRRDCFERGFVISEEEREDVLEEVGKIYGMESGDVDEYLWADRDKNEVLSSTPDVTPERLIKRYNISLTQTLLFNALEMDIAVSDNFREIFSMIKFLGLMYSVNGKRRINVTGPASLFKKTRKYGTSMAKLLPCVMKAEKWKIQAQVETEVGGETRIYQFELDSDRHQLFPKMGTVESYDSGLERSFASRISSRADGWKVSREPTFLQAGDSVMIPDFGFERRGEKLYLEIVGFWTPEYLREKIRKVRELDPSEELMFVVDERLKCTKEDFGDKRNVFFFKDEVPLHRVMERLRDKEQKLVERDLCKIEDGEIEVTMDGDPIVDLEEYSSSIGLEKKAIEEYIEEEYAGCISNDKYVPPEVLAELEERIDSLDSKKLSDVNKVLEEYGLAQNILEEIGYSVTYTTLKQDELKIERKE